MIHLKIKIRWRQTLQDVDVTIPVPKGTRGRDLQVELKKKHIKVALKGQPAIIEVIHIFITTIIYSIQCIDQDNQQSFRLLG